MKKIFLTSIILLSVVYVFANTPDSVFVKGYATGKNNNKNGLHLAYSIDGKSWKSIGNEFSFLKSDYGTWGPDKKMFAPTLHKNAEVLWTCRFIANREHKVTAITTSKDLIHWTTQNYSLNKESVAGQAHNDSIFKVSWDFVENLLNHCELTAFRRQKYAETAQSIAQKYAGLEPINASLSIDFEEKKQISKNLIGVFFEDLNYAADGGLYAELIQNRDFEYSSKDRNGWNAGTAWEISSGKLTVDTVNSLHKNNPHYAVLQDGETLINGGFDGIALKHGERYDFSVFVRSEKSGKLSARLIDERGNSVSNEITVNVNSRKWKKYGAVFVANKATNSARLQISSLSVVNVDMISLFPQKTFKDRQNGLREDLATAIADIKPRFVRFPGGCLAHGSGLDNIYHWKTSIGKLEERKPDFNCWGYHQTKGLGYFEYFQFCEDIGAEPLPVLAAGVPCQNSPFNPKSGLAGQQGGIPMNEMPAYIQDILDLIEWANGDKSTQWGKIRAQAGHPAPFNLKYIGIGNEDLISNVFMERFEMIYSAIHEKHPEITVIGTVGAGYKNEGSDYETGWDFASRLTVPIVDEHIYAPPGWFVHNQDYYDNYDRSKPKVYFGEYAVHLQGNPRPNNIESALTEAIALCNIERNGDIVEMTSYAPLLAKENHTQWHPDLIYFNNTEVRLTPGYEVQKLFGNNAGDEYISSALKISNPYSDIQKRIVHSVVCDAKTGDLLVKLVNLLPVETNVEFKNFADLSEKIEKTVLQGNPEDKTAKPVYEIIDMHDNKIVLPEYSFTILKIKGNKYEH